MLLTILNSLIPVTVIQGQPVSSKQRVQSLQSHIYNSFYIRDKDDEESTESVPNTPTAKTKSLEFGPVLFDSKAIKTNEKEKRYVKYVSWTP